MTTSTGDVRRDAASAGERALQEQMAAINAHDTARLAATYAPNAVVVDPQYPEPLQGRQAVERDAADFLAAFPDLTVGTSRTLVEGATLAVELTMSGTNTGPIALPDGEVPATGRRVELRMAVFSTIDADGLVADERRYYDVAGELRQLGLAG